MATRAGEAVPAHASGPAMNSGPASAHPAQCPAHPLLGRTLCRVGGCRTTVHGGTGGVCWHCFTRLRGHGLRGQQIAGSAELPPLPPRPSGCAVPDCQRMAPAPRSTLCEPHRRRFRRQPGASLEQFLADPRLRPLPALGPCQVAACSRRAESEHGYCPTHYVRWRTTITTDPDTDQRHWQLTHPAVSEGGQISLRALPPVVVLEELPRHRGGGASNVRTKVNALARLAESLRIRADHGLVPERLGRPDIEAFLNRLAYLESTGTISRYHRNTICRGARAALAGIRALGLTRPGRVSPRAR